MKEALTAVIGLALLGWAVSAEGADRTGARGIHREAFQPWPEALVLESRDAAARAVVVPEIGGRVVSYGPKEENLLWLDPGASQPGGFQCDIGPEVAGLPEHPGIWSGPYEWSARKGYLLELKGPEDKGLGIELEKSLVFDPNTGELGFVHRMKNVGERDTALCFWHRIACRPGGFVMIPLNSKSRFPARWCIKRGEGAQATYDGGQPGASGVRILGDVLVAQTGGEAAKVGADSDGQWVAYVLGKQVLVVHFPIYGSATYSEGGNTVTATWDTRMTEIAPMSPEARLRSRKTYEFPTKWTLLTLPSEVTTHDEARALVSQIPGSPFL